MCSHNNPEIKKIDRRQFEIKNKHGGKLPGFHSQEIYNLEHY